MRVTREKAAENRARIVATASRLFRASAAALAARAAHGRVSDRKIAARCPDVPSDQIECCRSPDYHDFTISSAFRATDQPATRSALLIANWKGRGHGIPDAPGRPRIGLSEAGSHRASAPQLTFTRFLCRGHDFALETLLDNRSLVRGTAPVVCLGLSQWLLWNRPETAAGLMCLAAPALHAGRARGKG